VTEREKSREREDEESGGGGGGERDAVGSRATAGLQLPRRCNPYEWITKGRARAERCDSPLPLPAPSPRSTPAYSFRGITGLRDVIYVISAADRARVRARTGLMESPCALRSGYRGL